MSTIPVKDLRPVQYASRRAVSPLPASVAFKTRDIVLDHGLRNRQIPDVGDAGDHDRLRAGAFPAKREGLSLDRHCMRVGSLNYQCRAVIEVKPEVTEWCGP